MKMSWRERAFRFLAVGITVPLFLLGSTLLGQWREDRHEQLMEEAAAQFTEEVRVCREIMEAAPDALEFSRADGCREVRRAMMCLVEVCGRVSSSALGRHRPKLASQCAATSRLIRGLLEKDCASR